LKLPPNASARRRRTEPGDADRARRCRTAFTLPRTQAADGSIFVGLLAFSLAPRRRPAAQTGRVETRCQSRTRPCTDRYLVRL
jgi:hypothetical protein